MLGSPAPPGQPAGELSECRDSGVPADGPGRESGPRGRPGVHSGHAGRGRQLRQLDGSRPPGAHSGGGLARSRADGPARRLCFCEPEARCPRPRADDLRLRIQAVGRPLERGGRRLPVCARRAASTSGQPAGGRGASRRHGHRQSAAHRQRPEPGPGAAPGAYGHGRHHRARRGARPENQSAGALRLGERASQRRGHRGRRAGPLRAGGAGRRGAGGEQRGVRHGNGARGGRNRSGHGALAALGLRAGGRAGAGREPGPAQDYEKGAGRAAAQLRNGQSLGRNLHPTPNDQLRHAGLRNGEREPVFRTGRLPPLGGRLPDDGRGAAAPDQRSTPDQSLHEIAAAVF